MILNPEDSVQINSGTTFGECWGYCSFSLELDDGFTSFTATGWDLNGVLPNLSIEESLYIGNGESPVETKQILLIGHANKIKNIINWELNKIN